MWQGALLLFGIKERTEQSLYVAISSLLSQLPRTPPFLCLAR